MPIDVKKYPDEWFQITYFLKEFHAWRCEHCGATHGSRRVNADGETYAVVLTCAHLNHDVENPEAELAVLCSACHLNYDRPIHLAHMREAFYRRYLLTQLAAGQLVLIKEALPDWAISLS